RRHARPVRAAAGVPFHTRCVHAMDVCTREMPAMTPIAGGGEAACHLQTSGPTLAGRALTDQEVPA
ncbi:MAG TPA: hypothetical protein VD903_04790, partial [Pseudonocardia sp.]|nr:hypothetical protein [Pseudonocardia sp.]